MRPLPTLVLAGGFLGAGKTTLLLAAARRLSERGLRCSMITNDQGGDLVDTSLAAAHGLAVEEVAGACFCCRFSELAAAAGRLSKLEPDVIFAEPVGSCIDVAATVVQPLKALYGERLRVAPFTVLVDPGRAAAVLSGEAGPHVAYLFRNQIDEADILCFTKADCYSSFPEVPGRAPRRMSARTGMGVDAWLDEVLEWSLESGGKTIEVDYAEYAAAEAALGWLNWRGDLRFCKAVTPAEVAGRLHEALDELLTRAGASIAHAKLFARAWSGYVKASVCRNGDVPEAEGDLCAKPARKHALTVNVRASAAPETLEAALDEALARFHATIDERARQVFRPPAPNPEKRPA